MSDYNSVYVDGIESCITDSTNALRDIEEHMKGILGALTESNRIKSEHLTLVKNRPGSPPFTSNMQVR